MITVKYIPNVLSQEGRKTVTLISCHTATVRDYIIKAGVPLEDVRIIRSGRVVKDLTEKLDDIDELIVLPDVKFDPGTWAVIVAVFKIITAIATVAAIGYSIYQAVTYRKPATPSFGNIGSAGSPSLEDGPTYGWDGVQTTQEVGRPVPIVYGEHVAGGNIINAYISTDGDKNYLNVLLGLCEGEIDSIGTIKINDNPIENFTGMTKYERYGTNDQVVIPNFEDLHSTHDINAQLLKDAPYTYTTTGVNIEAFEIYLKLPTGIFYQNSSDGSINSWSVDYKVEYKLHSSGTWVDLGTTTISFKSRSVVRRIYRKDGLTPGQYDIRITRTSADSDFYNTGDLYIQSIDEITTDDLAYPNTALLGLKALASEQLSGGVPNITCVIKGKKVSQPQIMNGAVEVDWEDYYYDKDTSQWKLLADDTVLSWDGTTYVTKWCANPAWCLKDLLINTRYGLGEFITTAMLNDADFLSMAKYCDEKTHDGNGGYEKRMRLDVVIDSAVRAPDLFQQLASAFRGMMFYSEGAIKVKPDREETAVQMFGMGNVIESNFSFNWKSKKDVYNVVEATFIDKDKGYKQEQISYIDEDAVAAGDPIRKKQIRVFTTRVSQAIREARYALWANKYINRSVSFKVGIDAIAIQAGDIINISHDLPQIGDSGRVVSGTINSVTLDKPITIVAGYTYKIKVRLGTTDTIEEKTVSNAAGTHTVINVTTNFSQAPAAYDIYAIGKSTILVKPFRVMSLQKDSKNEVTVSAIEYNESLYDDTAVVLPTNNYSDLTLTVPDVTNLSVTEGIVKLGDGTIEDIIDIYFSKPVVTGYRLHAYQKARIYISDDSGDSWTYRGETYDETFRIQGGLVDGKTYTISVVSVADDGIANPVGDSPQTSITTTGKSSPPQDVTNFAVSFANSHVEFTWQEVTDVDLAGYEIRELSFENASWELGTVIATGLQGFNYSLLAFTAGQKYYAIKAYDTSGNYSETADYASIYISDLSDTNVVHTFEDTDFSGTLSGEIEKCWMKGYSNDYYRPGLSLRTDKLWGTWVWGTDDFGRPMTASTGQYTTPVTDLGAVYAAGVTLELGIANVQGGQLVTEIAYSDTNPNPTNWTTFATGTYTGRYFRFRLTISTSDPNYGVDIYKIKAVFDVPDKTESGANIAVAGTGWTTVTLTGFVHVSSLIISVRGGPYVFQTDESALPASFNVKLLNPAAGMAQVAGAINYLASGY